MKPTEKDLERAGEIESTINAIYGAGVRSSGVLVPRIAQWLCQERARAIRAVEDAGGDNAGYHVDAIQRAAEAAFT